MKPSLTDRQSDVLRLKATGLTNKCIAREMGLSYDRIKDISSEIRVKFQAKGDFCEVILRAERLGMLAGVHV